MVIVGVLFHRHLFYWFAKMTRKIAKRFTGDGRRQLIYKKGGELHQFPTPFRYACSLVSPPLPILSTYVFYLSSVGRILLHDYPFRDLLTAGLRYPHDTTWSKGGLRCKTSTPQMTKWSDESASLHGPLCFLQIKIGQFEEQYEEFTLTGHLFFSAFE